MRINAFVLLVVGLLIFQHCYSHTYQQLDGYFLSKIGRHVIYHDYDEEELDESTPSSLFLFDMKTKEKNVLLSNCIYWDLVQVNDSSNMYTDGSAIFLYNILLKNKEVIYSELNENLVIHELASVDDKLFCFEVDYSNKLWFLSALYPNNKSVIYSNSFVSNESIDIYSYVISNKIVFRLQNLLYVYDLKNKNIKILNSRSTDFSISGTNSILYSFLNENNQRKLMEYNLLLDKGVEITDLPFKLHYHDFFVRSINGDNQTYYKKGSEIYLFADYQWIKKDIDSFLIYQDKKVSVFINKERGFIVKD